MIETTEKKIRSFWSRPEGKVGALFIIAIIALIAINITSILAFLITLMANTLTLIALVVAVGVILYILFDPKMRALIWYMYKSFMRWLTGLFIQLDPIKILESYIEYLYKNLQEMNQHISRLKGQISKLKSIINKNKREMEQTLRIAEQAKKQGNKELVVINTRQYGRLKETNEKYEVLLKKLELLYRVLAKIHKNTGYLIKDTENEVRIRKQEAQAIKAGHSAMKRAMSIINGDPDKKELFDMANEALVEDIHNKIGEMERFIEISSSVIDSIDLQNAVYEQEGLELLEKMEKEGMSFLLDDTDIDTVTGKNKENDKDVDKDLGSLSNYTNLFE